MKLMDLDYQIQYKKGINNAATDALSRCVTDQGVLAVSECIPSWVPKLREGYEEFEEDKKLLAELAISGTNDKSFELKEEIIRFQGRIWVGHNTLAQQHILQALHASGKQPTIELNPCLLGQA